VPECGVGRVSQVEIGPLPVPHLMGTWPVTAIPHQGV
jgi:hypothetical protein